MLRQLGFGIKMQLHFIILEEMDKKFIEIQIVLIL